MIKQLPKHEDEWSYEYQRIIPEVMKEVYTQFVNEQIEQLRSMVENNLPWEVSEQERPSFLINEAQKLMPDKSRTSSQPIHSARQLSQAMGITKAHLEGEVRHYMVHSCRTSSRDQI